MFQELNLALGGIGYGLTPVFELHPIQHNAYLEFVWDNWRAARPLFPDHGLPSATYPGMGRFFAANSLLQRSLNVVDPDYQINGVPLANSMSVATLVAGTPILAGGRLLRPWPHLMYAYLIENTRVYDIFERIVTLARRDDAFGALNVASHSWLRCTEELFFRDQPTGSISALTSWVRSDLRASRRNAYQRMFGMDLNHAPPQDETQRPTIVNSEFVRTFEELLRQLWRGYENRGNTTGPNRSDDNAITDLILRLKDMMSSRRASLPIATTATNLAREELVFVSMMSWFHLTIISNAPIIQDLSAASPAPEDVLRRLGERVKIPAHSRTRNLLFLANTLPGFLTLIEDGILNPVPPLAIYGVPGALQTMVLDIINHWQGATGVDLKTFGAASQA